MSGLDTFIYYATAPIRAFGRSRYVRWGVAAFCVVAIFFSVTLWMLNRIVPTDSGLPEALAILQPPKPLQPVTRACTHGHRPIARRHRSTRIRRQER
jgi:hypothetical protein